MAVNDTGATGITLKQLADTLLEKDADKKITQEELRLFVSEHQIEFLSINNGNQKTIEQMMADLQAELKDSYVGKDKEDKSKEAESKDTDTTSSDTSANTEEYNKLQKQVEQYKKDIETFTSKKTGLEASKTKKAAEIIAKKAEFDKLEKEVSEENEEYKRIIEKINQATKDAEEDIKYQQKRAVYSALAAYNPNEDGEWDSYIEKRFNNEDFTSAFTSAVKGLTSKADFVSSKLQVLGSKFSAIGNELETLNNEYKTITNDITTTNSTLETTKASLSEAEKALSKAVPNLVTEAEMQLVKDNNIDLKEKLSDGKPRYIFAKGKQDGAYHIYDMKNNGASLARQYGSSGTVSNTNNNANTNVNTNVKGANTNINSIVNGVNTNADGTNANVITNSSADTASNVNLSAFTNANVNTKIGGLKCKGSDIVPMGNGYLNNFKESDCGEKYYYMDECGNMQSGNADYCTSSPLSFDLNGDGVKTSSKVIDYDIDGDGIVDKINDSADAVLVFDKDGDGISGKDGSETFGDNTDLDGDGKADGYKDGFEALKALAKKEGLINGEDDNELDEKDLKVLEEKHGLKIKTNGYNSEAKSLSDTGITSIKLSKDNETSLEDNFDGNGNQLMTQKGATFTVNGEEKEYADIWHRKLETSETSENFFVSNELSSSLSFDIGSTFNKVSENDALLNQAKINTKAALRNIENFGSNAFMTLVSNKAKAMQEEAKKEAEREQAEKELEEQQLKEKEIKQEKQNKLEEKIEERIREEIEKRTEENNGEELQSVIKEKIAEEVRKELEKEAK